MSALADAEGSHWSHRLLVAGDAPAIVIPPKPAAKAKQMKAAIGARDPLIYPLGIAERSIAEADDADAGGLCEMRLQDS